MYIAQAAAGLGAFTAGQTLTAGDAAQIQTLDANATQQAALYASCKTQRLYYAAGALVAGVVLGKLLSR